MKPWPPPGRIGCCVIGCKRTASQEKYPGCSRIICPICWKLAPQSFRRRVRRIERIARKMGVDLDGMLDWPPPGTVERRLALLHAQAFENLVKAAIEVKVGIRALTPTPARKHKSRMGNTRTRRTL